MGFNFEKSSSYLVCPKCHADLVKDGDSLVCTNPDVRLKYPILDEIPRLLVEEAKNSLRTNGSQQCNGPDVKEHTVTSRLWCVLTTCGELDSLHVPWPILLDAVFKLFKLFSCLSDLS
jgi:uncharacterized protein YbaR (Trm112 family)